MTLTDLIAGIFVIIVLWRFDMAMHGFEEQILGRKIPRWWEGKKDDLG